MNITRRRTFGLILGASLPASASEPQKVDVTQTNFAPDGETPDHLEPSDSKVPEYSYLAQFVSFPSFTEGDYMALVKGEKTNTFELRVAKVRGQSELTEVPTASHTTSVPESLAHPIYELWANMLYEVRYPKAAYHGLDGATYVFSTLIRALGWMHGSIWSPNKNKPPLWLLETASDLIGFARLGGKDLEAVTKRTIATRDRYFAYLKKNGRH
jgi:hypothetical protein